MMVEIANLQDVSKKTEGEQGEFIDQLRDQISALHRDSEVKEATWQEDANKLKKKLDLAEREKENLESALNNIERNHSDLARKYE